jgi:hypothetical protein
MRSVPASDQWKRGESKDALVMPVSLSAEPVEHLWLENVRCTCSLHVLLLILHMPASGDMRADKLHAHTSHHPLIFYLVCSA